MSTDKRPVFPTEFTNESDRNTTAPDGQLVPPGGLVLMTGITLRQHYAGIALQGMLASMRSCPECGPSEPVEFARAIGRDCWKLADALIATEHGGE